MKNLIAKAKVKSTQLWYKARSVLHDRAGENYVDTGVKILIAVVIGALLLAGLYTLFGDVVCPRLHRRSRKCSTTPADECVVTLGRKGSRNDSLTCQGILQ